MYSFLLPYILVESNNDLLVKPYKSTTKKVRAQKSISSFVTPLWSYILVNFWKERNIFLWFLKNKNMCLQFQTLLSIHHFFWSFFFLPSLSSFPLFFLVNGYWSLVLSWGVQQVSVSNLHGNTTQLIFFIIINSWSHLYEIPPFSTLLWPCLHSSCSRELVDRPFKTLFRYGLLSAIRWNPFLRFLSGKGCRYNGGVWTEGEGESTCKS